MSPVKQQLLIGSINSLTFGVLAAMLGGANLALDNQFSALLLILGSLLSIRNAAVAFGLFRQQT